MSRIRRRFTAEQKAQITAEQKAQITAEQKAQITAEQKAQITAEQKAQITAEQKAQITAEQKAQITAEQKAQIVRRHLIAKESRQVRLADRLRTLVTPVKVHADSERLATFLEQHLDEVFSLLRDPDVVCPKNDECESERCYYVIARKLSGGKCPPRHHRLLFISQISQSRKHSSIPMSTRLGGAE